MPSGSSLEQVIFWLAPVVRFWFGITPPPPVLTPWEQIEAHTLVVWQRLSHLTIPQMMDRLFLALLLLYCLYTVVTRVLYVIWVVVGYVLTRIRAWPEFMIVCPCHVAPAA
jgi:hypothetical protein